MYIHIYIYIYIHVCVYIYIYILHGRLSAVRGRGGSKTGADKSELSDPSELTYIYIYIYIHMYIYNVYSN